MDWSKHKNTVLLILIIALTIASVFILYDFNTQEFRIKLGLDLRSGTHLTVQLKPILDPVTQKIKKIDHPMVMQTIGVLGRRLNPQGTQELIIQPAGLDRIIIEIPEETDIKKVENLISKTAHLEFKEQHYNPAKKTMDWKIVLDGTAIRKSQEEFGSGGQPIVTFELTKQGAKEFAKITERNVGKPLAIFFDGKLVTAPNVNEPIIGGSGQISGGQMTIEECRDIAMFLNAGALPVPIEILESSTVSPALGQESLKKSLIAGLIGLGLVCIFMIWYYLLPGVVADIALAIYTLFLLASMVVGNFVLTLSGIAGFILSIGMAVDANILIFERLKEELATGKTLKSSMSAGFKRAFSSILDGHVTTFIGAMVLYYFGSSSIKGFGLTLMLGTAWSLVTAVFITRVIIEFIINNNLALSHRLYGQKTSQVAVENQ